MSETSAPPVSLASLSSPTSPTSPTPLPTSRAGKEKDPTKFRHFNIDTDTYKYELPTECIKRPGLNTSGQAVAINVNSYAVAKFPDLKIHQYDVSTPCFLAFKCHYVARLSYFELAL